MVSLLKSFVMLFVINQYSCCSCGVHHIQDEFCEAEVVIRGRDVSKHNPSKPVKNNIEVLNSEVTYDVEITEILKVPDTTNIKAGDTIKAVTPGQNRICSGHLAFGVDTIITGRLNERGQLSFDQCSFQRGFDQLTKFELEGLKGLFTCDCSVTWHTWDYEKYENCLRNSVYSGYKLSCLDRHARCIRNEGFECEWDVPASEKERCKL